MIIWQHKHMFIFCVCLHLCFFLRESSQPSLWSRQNSPANGPHASLCIDQTQTHLFQQSVSLHVFFVLWDTHRSGELVWGGVSSVEYHEAIIDRFQVIWSLHVYRSFRNLKPLCAVQYWISNTQLALLLSFFSAQTSAVLLDCAKVSARG